MKLNETESVFKWFLLSVWLFSFVLWCCENEKENKLLKKNSKTIRRKSDSRIHLECSRLIPILDSGNFRVESRRRKKNVSNIPIWTFVDISTPFGGRVLDMNNTNFSRPLINAIWELKISKDKKKKSKEIKREKKEISGAAQSEAYKSSRSQGERQENNKTIVNKF